MIIILIGEASNIKDTIRYMEVMQHEVLLDKKIDYSQICISAFLWVKVKEESPFFCLELMYMNSSSFWLEKESNSFRLTFNPWG
jgi:hypothetical protein